MPLGSKHTQIDDEEKKNYPNPEEAPTKKMDHPQKL